MGNVAVGWSGTSSGIGGGGGGNPHADQVIQVTLTASNGTTTITSVTPIPVGAVVWECGVSVATGFAGGTTIEVGQAGQLSEFQTTGDNTPAAMGLYQVFQDIVPATAAAVVATVVSTATTGAGFAYIRYSVPLP